ncbi:MAG TPA: hypothetical protein VF411_08900 [Bacteroidia bacterium]
MKNYLNILLLFLLTSCDNDKKTSDRQVVLAIPTFADFKLFTETYGQIVPVRHSNLLMRPQEEGSYGVYSLFDKSRAVEFGGGLGHLVVFSKKENSTNWTKGDTDQVFVEVIATSPYLKICDKINVGAKRTELIKAFGEPQINIADTIVYYDNQYTIASFIMDKDIITKIIYGRYNRQKLGDKITVDQIRSITNVP